MLPIKQAPNLLETKPPLSASGVSKQSDKYLLRSKISEGAFGTVYEALNKQTSRLICTRR